MSQNLASVPPIHVINLDRSPERLRRFQEINGHLKDVTRCVAADGATLDRQALIASGDVSVDLSYGPGTLGCSMSHIGLWKAAAEGRSITVMEDDAVTSRHFHSWAEAVLAELPDWDFVNWGCLLNPSFAWVDLGVTRVRLEGYGAPRCDSVDDRARFQADGRRRSAVKLLHAFGAQGYSISPKGAKAALEYCLPLRDRLIDFPDAEVSTWNTSLDVDLCGLFPDINAFLCIPPLVIQGLSESDRLSVDRASHEPERRTGRELEP